MTRKRERDLLEGISSLQDTVESSQSVLRLQKARAALDETLHEVDARQIDRELMTERLRRAAVLAGGHRPFEEMADRFRDALFTLTQTLRSEHRSHPITRLAESDGCLYSADKAGHIIKWTVQDRTWRKQHVFHMKSPVLALAANGCYLVSGHADGSVIGWRTDSNKKLGRFGPNEHRSAVNAVCFDSVSLTVYSASSDRTVKAWAVEQLAYIETLFGHQDTVLSLASCPQESRCVSVGGRDRTLRLWKIIDESQLVFRLSESEGGSLDEVVTVDNYVVSGSDSGVLSLWASSRKKPIANIDAHSAPITCLYSPEATDLVFSGSSDGLLKLWKVATVDGRPTIVAINEIPIPGYITGVALRYDVKNSSDHVQLAVAVGPEGRFGRWSVDPSIKPSILILSLKH